MIDHLRPLLKDCGLTHRECETYLALLVLGSATVQDIADRSHVSRTATYPALESLIDRGLAAEEKRFGKTVYVARSPDRLRESVSTEADIMRQRLVRLDGSMGELLAAFHDGQGKPRVQYVEGMEGILALREEIAMSQDPVLEWFVIDEFLQQIHEAAITRREKQMRLQHGRVIAILPVGMKMPAIDRQRFEVRVQSQQSPAFSGGVVITGKKAYLFTHGKAPSVLVFDSPSLVAMMKVMFENLWNQSKPG